MAQYRVNDLLPVSQMALFMLTFGTAACILLCGASEGRSRKLLHRH